ncbi:MAG: polyprenol monophosphomannose synthase [Phycisphaerales bacterium]|nr:polyprenol monophosphomannose synthase [Phycisphaerales bacterium]
MAQRSPTIRRNELATRDHSLESEVMIDEPVSIVVPTYEEAENLPILAKRVFAALEKAGIPGELIVVDDNSRDGTDAAVEQLAKDHPIRLITRTDERGLSSAVLRGFAEARHDLLVCMDADLSHPAESVPDLIRAVAENGAEFCIGSRYVEGGRTKEDWGFMRQLNSWGATLLAKPLTSAKDPMAGFFCLRRETLERAQASGVNPIGYKIALEIMVKAGCRRVAEVPIEFSDRLHGESKLTFHQQLLYLNHLLRLYRFRWPTAILLIAVITLVVIVALLYGLLFT